ncbi:hypothetical protein DID99_35645 [Burkholderia sp. Bp8986]|nr:hypothetical protein DID99_35645 [Burkholderia sp. Bp8986]
MPVLVYWHRINDLLCSAVDADAELALIGVLLSKDLDRRAGEIHHHRVTVACRVVKIAQVIIVARPVVGMLP